MGQSVDNTIIERESTHGEPFAQANVAQNIKHAMRKEPEWDQLSVLQAESLEMIATKISRIIKGNKNNLDSWLDLAGYAALVYNHLSSLSEDS